MEEKDKGKSKDWTCEYENELRGRFDASENKRKMKVSKKEENGC